MKFRNFLFLEIDRFFNKRKVIILLLFYLLSLFFIQLGIRSYKNDLKEIDSFQQFEKRRIESFQFYLQYGTYGFRLIYVPDSLSALFCNAGVIKINLNAFIDSGERMKIYESFKGKNAFIGFTSNFFNFSGFLFIIGSLMPLLYGFGTFRNRKFIAFVKSKMKSRCLHFLFILFSRVFILFGMSILILLTIWFMYVVNGLSINISFLVIYSIIAFLILVFFLSVGIAFSAIKSISAGITAVFTMWLLFIFGIPAIVDYIVYSRAESIISVHEMDIEKFKLLMRFEKKAKEQAGKTDIKKTNTEIRQQLFSYLLNNEFKEIMKHEQTMISQMKSIISLQNNLSLVFPSSLFLNVSNEISGKGYKNLIAFYEYAYKHKVGFVRYYGEKVFFSDETKIEPYLKGDENVFHAQSLLPDNFVFGLVFCLFWIALPLSFAFFLFNKLFQPSSKKLESDLKEKLQPENWKKNKTTVFITDEPELPSQFSRILGMREISHIMVPNPGDLPGMAKVADLCRFFGVSLPDGIQEVANKCISKVKPDKQALLILDLIKNVEAEFLVFDNFIVKLSDSGIELFCERLESLKKGRKIAYFSRSQLAAVTFSDAISKG